MSGVELLRRMILHTPRSPFTDDGALENLADVALAVADGQILAIGDYAAVRGSDPEAVVTDGHGSVILPGFIDAHAQFPQTRIIGGFGWRLVEKGWLQRGPENRPANTPLQCGWPFISPQRTRLHHLRPTLFE